MLALAMTQLAPIFTPSPSDTRPSNTQFTSISTSCPHASSPRISNRAGSASRTPCSIKRLRLAQLECALQLCQLQRAVHAFDLGLVGRDNGDHFDAILHRELHDVRQVVLALRVGIGQTRQPALEHRIGHRHESGVDLAQLALLAGGVLLLHDRAHRTVLAHDAAVAGRVGHFNAQQRELFSAAAGDQLAQGRRLDQRHVAVQDQRGAVVGQEGRRLLHGMAGPQLRLLAREARRRAAAGLRPAIHGRLNIGRAVTGDHHHVANRQRCHRIHDMLEQRTAGQTVQHFGQAALHARSLARRHDDHIDCCHALSLCS